MITRATLELRTLRTTLALRVLTPAASIKTFFPNLEPPGDFELPDKNAVVCVHVHSRKLADGLNGYHVDHESIVCIPHEKHALLFYVTLPDALGHLSFYVPVVQNDDESEDDDQNLARQLHHPAEAGPSFLCTASSRGPGASRPGGLSPRQQREARDRRPAP